MHPRNKEHMFTPGKMFCTEKYQTYLQEQKETALAAIRVRQILADISFAERSYMHA